MSYQGNPALAVEKSIRAYYVMTVSSSRIGNVPTSQPII
jgi:hypothetical protein